ncbi:peptidoglycan-binding protein [Streptomyces sp. A1-5]|uniref:peptidoglycan-binding protein n=1 Tax=Streptomyces sp. A1-5 TaxID=2738410 RepID=UPI001F259910|nr:peptidoglycan-binding protein [Streptomyces sp. A1-5]
MAWYSDAKKMELEPESDAQPAIRPTQLIFHSIAAPWTPERVYEYWRDSTNLESHFGVGFDGRVAQYIGTQTRADSNMYANRRSDGTGAVSVETASNLNHTDPWTPAQVSALIRLGVWMHQHHGVPLRICRNASDPGFGVHRMFAAWSDGGTACPGDARADQFRREVFPGIVAAAGGKPIPEPTGAVVIDGRKYGPGSSGDHITAMGRALVRAGCGRYKEGPGPRWTDADTESVRAWQILRGDDPQYCDGIPGPRQLARLLDMFGDARTHKVVRGETLSAIARTYGTTWQAIAKANGLTDPDRITPGQTLTLP